jgi:hypothetical protein
MLLVWLGCAAVYGTAAQHGAMVPTASWQAHERVLPPSYPAFEPLVYSLEHLVPFVDLQQRRLWAASAESAASEGWAAAARIVAWHEAVLGWALWLLVALCLISALNRRRGEA